MASTIIMQNFADWFDTLDLTLDHDQCDLIHDFMTALCVQNINYLTPL